MILCLGWHQHVRAQEQQEWVPLPFGTVSYRQNIVPSNRVPIEDRVTYPIGPRTLVTPSPKESGWTIRMQVSEQYDDNVQFTPTDKISDFITSFSPGVHYKTASPRGYLEVDYMLESALYAQTPEFNDLVESQAATVAGGYKFSPRDTLTLFNQFQQFKDPTGQVIPGVLRPRSQFTENVFLLNETHDYSPTTSLHAELRSFLSLIDDSSAVDSLLNEGYVGFMTEPVETSRIGGDYRLQHYRFDGAPNAFTQSLFFVHQYRPGKTTRFDWRVGPAFVQNDEDTVTAVGGFTFEASLSDFVAELAFDRDLNTSGGLGSVLLAQTVTLGGRWWAGEKLQLYVGAQASRIEELSASGLQFDVLQPFGMMTYAFSPNVVGALRYRYIRQDIRNFPNLTTEANVVTLSLVGSF